LIRHPTLERARGRWPQILNAFGIDRKFLRNKHGPCPCCGGKDRFRFDNLQGSGSYYCNGCGASKGDGAGIPLLMKLRNWDFKTACGEIDRLIGTDCRPPPPPIPAPAPPDPPYVELQRHWETSL